MKYYKSLSDYSAKELGCKLKDMRLTCGYEVEEIAEFLHISEEEYLELEEGEAEFISAFMVEKLCVLYWADVNILKARKPSICVSPQILYSVNKIIKDIQLLTELKGEFIMESLVEKWRDTEYMMEVKICDKINPVLDGLSYDVFPFVEEDCWGFSLKCFEELTDEQVNAVEEQGFWFDEEVPCFDCSVNYVFRAK